MRKNSVVIFIFLTVFVLCFSGCNSDTFLNPSNNTNEESVLEDKFLDFTIKEVDPLPNDKIVETTILWMDLQENTFFSKNFAGIRGIIRSIKEYETTLEVTSQSISNYITVFDFEITEILYQEGGLKIEDVIKISITYSTRRHIKNVDYSLESGKEYVIFIEDISNYTNQTFPDEPKFAQTLATVTEYYVYDVYAGVYECKDNSFDFSTIIGILKNDVNASSADAKPQYSKEALKDYSVFKAYLEEKFLEGKK